MKLLTNKDRMYGTVKLHNELDILQIQDIFETSVLNFVFKCVKDVPIEPFKNYFTFRHEHHDYNLRNNENITTNKILQNMDKNTTHFKGASLWNDLSDGIRSITDEKEFKRVLSKMYKGRYIENSQWHRTIRVVFIFFTANPQRAHSSTSLIDYFLIRNTALIIRYLTTNKNKTIKQITFIYSHSLLISSSRLPIANTCQTYSFISWHIIIHLFLFPYLSVRLVLST